LRHSGTFFPINISIQQNASESTQVSGHDRQSCRRSSHRQQTPNARRPAQQSGAPIETPDCKRNKEGELKRVLRTVPTHLS
jgi:hypothetical protein